MQNWVTDRNVCRIHDLHQHRDPGEPDFDLIFLTMELIEGEPLSERLRTGRTFTWKEALPFIRQVGSGLHAIHARGVIHGDLKPSNAIVRPNGDVVLTDFGLAHSPASTTTSKQPQAGVVLGTPDYIAPEASRGSSTVASDVYAFGVFIFELLTGKRPPSDPAKFTAELQSCGVPGNWKQAIARCLSNVPEERFARALDVVDALSDRHDWHSHHWTIAVAAGLVSSLVVSLAWVATKPFARPRPKRIAVLSFANEAHLPERDWVGLLIARAFEISLGSDNLLSVVPSEVVGQSRADLSLQGGDPFRADNLGIVLTNLAADSVLICSYRSPQDDRVVLNVQMRGGGAPNGFH